MKKILFISSILFIVSLLILVSCSSQVETESGITTYTENLATTVTIDDKQTENTSQETTNIETTKEFTETTTNLNDSTTYTEIDNSKATTEEIITTTEEIITTTEETTIRLFTFIYYDFYGNILSTHKNPTIGGRVDPILEDDENYHFVSWKYPERKGNDVYIVSPNYLPLGEWISESISVSEYLATTYKYFETATTSPIYARFDFGTKSIAQEKELTSHEYLVYALTYDNTAISVEFLEDSWKITSLLDFNDIGEVTYDINPIDSLWSLDGINMNSRFAIAFNDIAKADNKYNFTDTIKTGYGTWWGYPYNNDSVNVFEKWHGCYQYMKIRLINHTRNNMIGFRYRKNSNKLYYATTVVSNMYLQGGDRIKTCEPTDNWETYTYDVLFCSFWASLRGESIPKGIKTYEDAKEYVYVNKHAIGNNWSWWDQGQYIVAIEFNLLGAYAREHIDDCDSRNNITKGDWVEVDYIVFGSTPEQLEEYKSYIEQEIPLLETTTNKDY